MRKASAKASRAAPAAKIAQVIALLERADERQPDEMVAATSWLPHTTRVILSVSQPYQ